MAFMCFNPTYMLALLFLLFSFLVRTQFLLYL